MSKQVEKAAAKAAKDIKALPNPTKKQIAQIYQEFQSAAQNYGHMP